MKRLIGALAIVFTIFAIPALAAPIRTSKVGDRMGALVVGMVKVDSGAETACGRTPVRIFDYVVPGRPLDEDHASFIGIWAYDRLVILVSFDDEDLSAPVEVYADLTGDGLVTHLWAVDDAPSGCQLILKAQHA